MKDRLSARQLGVIFFVGLLSPAAAVAGMDWRGGVLALPMVMAVAYSWKFHGREAGGWTEKWKGGMRVALSVVYIMYLVAAAGTALASAGERVAAPDGKGVGWIVVLLWTPVVVLTRKKITVLGRMSEIFYLVMSAALVVVLVFGGMQIEPGHLLAQRGNIGGSALAAAGVCCMGVAALLLWEGEGTEGEPRWGVWGGVLIVLIGLMRVVTIGTLGGVLAGEKARPFFTMTVGLGKTARVEGVVSAVWLLADVIFVGLCCACGSKLWGVLMGEGRLRGGGYPFALAVLGAGIWLGVTGKAALMQEWVLPAGGIILGGGVPMVACLAEKMRGEKRRRKKQKKTKKNEKWG